MEIINVIKEPYAVRKNIRSLPKNKFVLTFLVDKKANKIMIKKAFKAVFGVKVKDVNTVMKHPKPTRATVHSRRNFTKEKKLAYISLTREDFLNLKKIIEGEAALQEAEMQLKLSQSVETSQPPSEKSVSKKEDSSDKEVKKVEKEAKASKTEKNQEQEDAKAQSKEPESQKTNKTEEKV